MNELVLNVGLLGAEMPSGTIYEHQWTSARFEMIELRILRIEKALRRAGIEVEQIELREGQ